MSDLMVQLYLQRDRLKFLAGVLEAIVGVAGMAIAYALLGEKTAPPAFSLVWWLAWWGLIVGGWLVATGGITATKGWTDPLVEKERQLWAEKQKQGK